RTGPRTAIVSEAFARNHFGGSSAAIGRTIRLFSVLPVSVVGVVPAGFAYPEGTDIWHPMPVPDAANPLSRGGENFRAVALVKSRVSIEQAQSEITTIARQLEQQYPDTNTGRHIVVTRLRDHIVTNVRFMLYLMLAAVALVLLIGCTNVATLLL